MAGTDENQPLAKVSLFAVSKGVAGIAGKDVKIKRLQDGNLLLECPKQCHSENLLKCVSFVNVPVCVSAHHSLNTCKGVVRNKELAWVPEEEIKKNLPFVNSVKRIIIKRDGSDFATNT